MGITRGYAGTEVRRMSPGANPQLPVVRAFQGSSAQATEGLLQ
ncbi:hypothetical protein PIIN_11495 [Serendipita indica DSM 11827]|uniref:Uncharacterized protein n=1 Tax=Serendipita indica (strain DSM 11827) TaxID=1109443 RepID=G4U1S5_SERID|nr:hypothetical protein PIIN_11495 [Serendipita indica DSM 11827]